MIHYIESNRINNEVLNNNDKLVVVCFYAKWSLPCKEFTTVLTDIEKTYFDDIEIFVVDVDEAQEIKIRYGINSTPTTICFKNGEEVERQVGIIKKEQLENIINFYKWITFVGVGVLDDPKFKKCRK